MRTFLNNILIFIVAETLTDPEFDTVLSTHQLFDQTTYTDLLNILNSRDTIGPYQARLLNFYQAKGVSIVAGKKAKSNIYLGSVL